MDTQKIGLFDRGEINVFHNRPNSIGQILSDNYNGVR